MARTVLRWDGDALSGLIEFDAVTLEAPRYEVAITEYPVELGADLVDHIRVMPVPLRINGIVTNTPARLGLTQMDGAIPATERAIRVRQPLIPAPPGLVPTSVAGFPLEREVTAIAQVRTWSEAGERIQRVQNVLQLLVDSMNQAREFTVSTDLLGDFDRMLIKLIEPERTSTSGSGVSVSITMRQVSFAELVRRDVSHLLKKKAPKAKSSEELKDAGKKEAPVADQSSDSWLYDIWGALSP
jgi:hypothetical protein